MSPTENHHLEKPARGSDDVGDWICGQRNRTRPEFAASRNLAHFSKIYFLQFCVGFRLRVIWLSTEPPTRCCVTTAPDGVFAGSLSR